MEQQGSDVPWDQGALAVGVVYNLQKGLKTTIPDAEAEYDSLETVYALKSALEAGGHRVVLLEVDEALPEKLRQERIDIAFNIAEGLEGRGREAQIPAMLSFWGIPFTGSDETTLCLALDKALTKQLLISYGIRTPKYALLSEENPWPAIDLCYPGIVKPNAEGSSKGIANNNIVTSAQDLYDLAHRCIGLYQGAILAEEYIAGREFTVGLLGNGSKVRVFPPMEIIYKKSTQDHFHVYSYNVKKNYKEYITYQCPAALSVKQTNEMTEIAKKVYTSLGCRDLARIDFRMSAGGEVYFIEVNPLPGLAPAYSDYPMLAEFCGIGYTELINRILLAASQRLKIKKRGEVA